MQSVMKRALFQCLRDWSGVGLAYLMTLKEGKPGVNILQKKEL